MTNTQSVLSDLGLDISTMADDEQFLGIVPGNIWKSSQALGTAMT